jgi:hypothetical protein
MESLVTVTLGMEQEIVIQIKFDDMTDHSSPRFVLSGHSLQLNISGYVLGKKGT